MATSSFEMGFIWPPVTVLVKLSADGSVKLNSGTSDMGTGTKTWYAQVVAEELGIKPETIEMEYGDTGTTNFSQVSAGSRTTPTDSPAVREACIDLKQKLIEIAAKDLKVDPATLEVAPGEVVSTADRSKKVKFTDLSELKNYQALVGMGRSGGNPPNKRVKPFCAHFCEVEVNMKVKVLRYVATQDSGRVMNKLTLSNQLVGGSVQGISHVLSEARVMDGAHMGRILNKNMLDYKVATIMDVPTDWTTLFVEPIDPDLSSSAAKGGGEPPRIPPNAAVANAIYNATGIRFTTLPINPLQLKA
jgi:xanthine dehydrogenase YagR molybdenum-binding subunit